MNITIKTITYLLLPIFIILLAVPHAYADGNADICSAVLDSTTPTVSNCRVSMGRDTDVTLKSAWGSKGWALETGLIAEGGYSTDSAYLYIDIDDDVCYRPEKHETMILTVNYLNEDNAKLAVEYDGYDSINSYAGHVNVVSEGTGMWKKVSFLLDNPRFANQLNGYDIVLSVYSDCLPLSDNSVAVRSINLSKGDDKPIDIKISSDRIGNAFYNAEQPSLKVDAENVYSAEQTFDLDIVVSDRASGEIMYEESRNMYLEAGKSQSFSIEPEVDYGIYDILVTVTSQGGSQSSAKSEFSRISAPLKGEGIYDDYGVATHFYSQRGLSGEQIMPMMSRAGFGLVRDSINWHSVEVEKGVFELPETLISFVNNAKESGMEPLMSIGGGSNRALYPDLKPYSREDLRATDPEAADIAEEKFKEYLEVTYNFVYNTVSLLGDSVKYYEAGNEYNLAVTNNFFPEDGVQNRAADYARILRAIYEGVKDANPNAVVVGGVLSEMHDGTGYFEIPSYYVEELYECGAGQWMDCLSVHFYKHDSNPGQPNYKAMEELKAVKDIINANAEQYGDKELWVTEYSWRSFDGYKTELQQAENLVASRVLFERDNLPDRAFWYLFEGRLSEGLDSRTQDYAIVTTYIDSNATGIVTGAPKPAYLANANYSKLMHNAVFKEDKSTGNKQEYLFYDRVNEVDVSVVWSLSGNETFTFSEEDYETLTAVDIYGNVSALEAVNGEYTLTVGTTPVYVMPMLETDKLTLVEDNYSKIRFSGVIPTDKPVNIGVALLNPGKTKSDFKINPLESSAYIGQIITDSEGRYNELIKLSGDGGTYTLLYGIGGDDIRELEITWYKTAYDTELVITQNGANVESISAFNPAESFGLNINVNNARALSGKCVLVTAFYSGNTLVDCKTIDGVIETAETVKIFTNTEPLSLPDGAQVDRIKLLMIDSFDNLVPLASVKTIE